MARLNATEAAQLWAQRTAAATTQYQNGVRRVTEAPGAKAARNKQGYVNGVNQNANKWEANVAAVPLGDWQQMTISKGAANLATGVNAAQGKMAGKMAKVLSDVDAAVSKLASMPKGTFEQRKARANAYMDDMHARSAVGR